MQTLSDILIAVNSYVDLEAVEPTSTDLDTRINYANQAVWDAISLAQLNEFAKEYEVDPVSSTSIALPEGFHEFMGNPKQLVNGGWNDFPEIDPKEKYNKPSAERYVYITGNPAAGYVANFNGLEASCTISIQYQCFPTGFPTLTSRCELSDPTYVIAAVESYVLQSRGDDRFPYVDSIKDRKLKNLIGRGMKSPGGQGRVVPAGFKSPLS